MKNEINKNQAKFSEPSSFLTVDTIYFDFSKGFDTVPHKRLLKEVSAYSITEYILG